MKPTVLHSAVSSPKTSHAFIYFTLQVVFTCLQPHPTVPPMHSSPPDGQLPYIEKNVKPRPVFCFSSGFFVVSLATSPAHPTARDVAGLT